MSFINELKSQRHKAYLALYRLMPIKKNKIIAWNSTFKGFGDSPKYIIEYLCENYKDKYDIVWVYDRTKEMPADIPSGVRCVKYFSTQYLKEIATAGIIISNIRTGKIHHFNKRKGQYYIQTWHSSIRLKKIEGDAASALGEEYVAKAKEDSSKCDLIVSGCDFSTEIFSRSFWYDGEILKSGTARSDVLFKDNGDIKKAVCASLGIPQNKKLVLYAPTFRDSACDQLHGIEPDKTVNALKNRFGGDWAFIYRLHPNVAQSVNVECENAYSATEYPDMQELVCACDVMITDYSSCMFDMCLRKKPCVLYAPDVDEYMKDERGFYFDIRSLPFPCVKDNSALCDALEGFDENKYISSCEEFLNKTGSYEDGCACRRIAEKIESVVSQ